MLCEAALPFSGTLSHLIVLHLSILCSHVSVQAAREALWERYLRMILWGSFDQCSCAYEHTLALARNILVL